MQQTALISTTGNSSQSALQWRSGGERWSRGQARDAMPIHIEFRIDNTSAVAWNNKLCSRNARAQDIIRLLGHWEVVFRLRFSASHVAGADNVQADAGSRSFTSPSHLALFKSRTRSWTQEPCQLTSDSFPRLWRTIIDSTQLPIPPLMCTEAL